MTLSPSEVAAWVLRAEVRPAATRARIAELCEERLEHGFDGSARGTVTGGVGDGEH